MPTNVTVMKGLYQLDFMLILKSKELLNNQNLIFLNCDPLSSMFIIQRLLIIIVIIRITLALFIISYITLLVKCTVLFLMLAYNPATFLNIFVIFQRLAFKFGRSISFHWFHKRI